MNVNLILKTKFNTESSIQFLNAIFTNENKSVRYSLMLSHTVRMVTWVFLWTCS